MSISASTGGNDDLQAAMMGGSSFEQRLSDLATAKKSLEDAYTDLGLGRAAKDAVAYAAKAKAEAEQALSDAKASAETMLAKAATDAQQTERRAAVRADELYAAKAAEAEALRADAEKFLAEAKAASAEAKAAAKDAKDKLKYANEIAEQAADNKKRSEEAADIYAAESAKLKSIREKVVAALSLIEGV